MKKEKGFTLVEVMISASLLLVIVFGIFKVISKYENKDRIDEIAYTSALQMFHLSEIANQYIKDNINESLPNSFDMNTLRNEGYVDADTQDIHILPFGRELKFYINNDYGFSLSIGMMATGEMKTTLLSSFNMDNDFNRLAYEQRVAAYLSDMVRNKNYSIGIIDPDYNMKWLNSNISFDLNPFIRKNNTEISNSHSTALFFNLQEEPGYYVMNYISSAFQNPNISETSSHSSLYTIGYSAFCPEPNIKMNAQPFNTTITNIKLQNGGSGDNFSNIYICIPSSKIDLEDHIEQEIGLVNQFHRGISYHNTLCYIRSSRSNIMEFRLRNNYYTLQAVSGMASLRCYRGFDPTFQAFKLNNQRFTQSSRNIDLNFSGSYTARIPSISVNRINLNEI